MFQITYVDGVAVILVLGDIDGASCNVIDEVMRIPSVVAADSVLLSFERCDHIDASCINNLLAAQADLGGRLRIIANDDSEPARVLSIHAVRRRFSVYPSVEAAMTDARPLRNEGR